MNPGRSFSFAQVAGIADAGLARFRPLNWAYLRDRIAPSDLVTGLHPAPLLLRVEPPSVSRGERDLQLRFVGENFLAGRVPPRIELVGGEASAPAPALVLEVAIVDRETLRGSLERAWLPRGVYGVRYVSPDGQIAALHAGFRVR